MRVGFGGTHVEIDETLITKRKYNRGRLVREQQWYFGGIERESSRCFIVPVEDRSAATLLPIIEEYVAPCEFVGSKGVFSGVLTFLVAHIYSDLWRAYGGIERLPHGYTHWRVNHSQNFIDPATGANTQRIESLWQKFKHRHKKEYGTASTTLASYIGQYVWMNQFGGEDVMYNLWSQISHRYPCT